MGCCFSKPTPTHIPNNPYSLARRSISSTSTTQGHLSWLARTRAALAQHRPRNALDASGANNPFMGYLEQAEDMTREAVDANLAGIMDVRWRWADIEEVVRVMEETGAFGVEGKRQELVRKMGELLRGILTRSEGGNDWEDDEGGSAEGSEIGRAV